MALISNRSSISILPNLLQGAFSNVFPDIFRFLSQGIFSNVYWNMPICPGRTGHIMPAYLDLI